MNKSAAESIMQNENWGREKDLRVQNDVTRNKNKNRLKWDKV